MWLDKAETDLFKGVTVFFTGYTDKFNIMQLKNQLQKHGATTSYAFSATHTTHIVCTNLSASKMKTFSSKPKRRLHIVHPNWIIDSIKAHEMQPESKYDIEITGKVSSILDYVEKEPKKAGDENGLVDAATEPTDVKTSLSSPSNSLSLSSEGTPDQTAQYKFTTHPLLKHRRSSSVSHRSKSHVQHEKEIGTYADSMKPPSYPVQTTAKQVRINAILKKQHVSSAQKPF